jgi:hypothetical protein
MPFAERHHRRVAAVSAKQKSDPARLGRGDRLDVHGELRFESLPHLGRQADPALSPDFALREGRGDGGTGIRYRVQIGLGREIGVKDPINAGEHGIARRAGSPRMDRDLGTMLVSLVDHRRESRQAARFARRPNGNRRS